MDYQSGPCCSHCQSPAVDYDVLFNSWCEACRERKWLINWGAQHQWYHQYFEQRNGGQASTRDLWVAFVKTAKNHEVSEAWLRIAIFEYSAGYKHHIDLSYLGTKYNYVSLPPPDQDTPYENILFRNEWEAKWACFFKNLQMKYSYLRGIEYKQDDLPASTAFWLQNLSWYRISAQETMGGDNRECLLREAQMVQGAYLIVTGPVPAYRERERLEYARHFVTRTGKGVYLLEGRIGLSTHWDGCTISYLTAQGEYLRPFCWYECLSCGAIGVFHTLFPEYRFCLCVKIKYQSVTSRLVQAYLAARYIHFYDQLPSPRILPI